MTLRVSDLALGELERSVLDFLWEVGSAAPGDVHARVGAPRRISVNTVSSALKRLFEKGLLTREKISHSYVYAAAVSRHELQRQLLQALADEFDDGGGLLAAFVDLAEAEGEKTLRRLERMVAARLAESDE